MAGYISTTIITRPCWIARATNYTRSKISLIRRPSDETGSVYAITAVKQTYGWLAIPASDQYFDYRTPSNTVEAYTPDGTLSWQKTLDQEVSWTYFMPSIWNDRIGVPIYENGTLYVPVDHGITALKKDGTIAWTKNYSEDVRLFYLMPTDSKGDIFMYYRQSDDNLVVEALDHDGNVIGTINAAAYIPYAYDGILYGDGRSSDQLSQSVSKDHLETAIVNAYSVEKGSQKWSFTTPIGETNTVTVNKSNVLALFPDYEANGYTANSITTPHSMAEIFPAGNFTYIYYRTAAWDSPVVYDNSSYTYYSAIYALDSDGRLVWQKPMDSFLTAAAANNSTIYYGTNGGGISVSAIEVVAGLAIAGSILLIFKFFVLGSVTRARSKIDKNDNRNRAYRFIVERPALRCTRCPKS